MKEDYCQNCWKPEELCLCGFIRPLATHSRLLILQHPQEPRQELSTARLAQLSLLGSTLCIGLSWSKLSHALGKEADNGTLHPKNWWVFYRVGEKSKKAGLEISSGSVNQDPLPEGLVFLDGTWSQAKTLWWRNPWLLKLRRVQIRSESQSRYENLRKQPKKDCLSTIESIAEAMDYLEPEAGVGQNLRAVFEELLKRKRKQIIYK